MLLLNVVACRDLAVHLAPQRIVPRRPLRVGPNLVPDLFPRSNPGHGTSPSRSVSQVLVLQVVLPRDVLVVEPGPVACLVAACRTMATRRGSKAKTIRSWSPDGVSAVTLALISPDQIHECWRMEGEILKELIRRHRRVAKRRDLFLQDDQERAGGQAVQVEQEVVWRLRFDVVRTEGVFGKVTKIARHDDLGSCGDRSSKYVSIFWVVGHAFDDARISGNRCLGERSAHLRYAAQRPLVVRQPVFDQVAPHFVENVLAPR